MLIKVKVTLQPKEYTEEITISTLGINIYQVYQNGIGKMVMVLYLCWIK